MVWLPKMLIQSWTKPVDAWLSRKLTFSCILLILILTPPLSHSYVYTHALSYATLASALKQSQDPSSQDHVRENLRWWWQKPLICLNSVNFLYVLVYPFGGFSMMFLNHEEVEGWVGWCPICYSWSLYSEAVLTVLTFPPWLKTPLILIAFINLKGSSALSTPVKILLFFV